MRRRYSAMDVDLLVLIRKFSVLTPIITVCYRSRSENKRPFYLESCSGGLVVKVADFSPQLWPPAIIFHWGALHSLPPAHWGEGLNAELCHNDNKSLFLLFFSFLFLQMRIKLTFLEMSLLRSQSHLKKLFPVTYLQRSYVNTPRSWTGKFYQKWEWVAGNKKKIRMPSHFQPKPDTVHTLFQLTHSYAHTQKNQQHKYVFPSWIKRPHPDLWYRLLLALFYWIQTCLVRQDPWQQFSFPVK